MPDAVRSLPPTAPPPDSERACRMNRWVASVMLCLAAWSAPTLLSAFDLTATLLFPEAYAAQTAAWRLVTTLHEASVFGLHGPVALAFRYAERHELGGYDFVLWTAAQWFGVAAAYAYLVVARGRLATPRAMAAALAATGAALAGCGYLAVTAGA